MVNEQLQDTYRPISQDVKTIRSSEIRSLNKISREKFFLKNHTQNVVEIISRLFSKKSKSSISLDQ